MGEEGLQLSAIVGLDDASSCFGTVPGTRYMAAAELLSGSVYSICSNDWDALLTSLGWSMISLESSFKLSQVPRETDSMVVTVGDVIVEQGSAWQFDATRNSIVFEAEAVPAYGSRIRVTCASEGLIVRVRNEPVSVQAHACGCSTRHIHGTLEEVIGRDKQDATEEQPPVSALGTLLNARAGRADRNGSGDHPDARLAC